jgi:2-amino-4-hydroxy-6-hydroxymethyldihydropteridine diphosphokinase
MHPMIVVALGANLPSVAGAPGFTIRAALSALSERGVGIGGVSHHWRSPAWPNAADPPYVNAAAELVTGLAPEALLAVLHDVEALFGRKRHADVPRNAPRTLDLDLIDYNGRVQAGTPTLPHPRMAERAFVLLPLREIAPEWRHPVSGARIDSLIAALAPASLDSVVRLADGAAVP